MPRRPRIVVPGEPHHVTQRGNDRQNIFHTDADRWFYLSTLRDRCQRYGVGIQAFCLMRNHVHLVCVPQASDSLAKAIGGTHVQFARYFNSNHERCGHVWQSRYFSIPMDPVHALFAMRYVERNPVRAGIVAAATHFRWSSAAAHCGGVDPSGLLNREWWSQRYPPDVWERMLNEPEDDKLCAALRRRTRKGQPLGSERFVAKLESA